MTRPSHLHYITRTLLSLCLFLLVACERPQQESSAPSAQTVNGDEQLLPAVELNAEQDSAPLVPDWSHHILSVDQGWISAEDRIRLRFHHPVVDVAEVGNEKPGLVRIQPSIEASVRYSAPDILEIVPASPLRSGQIYAVELSPVG